MKFDLARAAIYIPAMEVDLRDNDPLTPRERAAVRRMLLIARIRRLRRLGRLRRARGANG